MLKKKRRRPLNPSRKYFLANLGGGERVNALGRRRKKGGEKKQKKFVK